MTQKIVYVVGGDPQVEKMFRNAGWLPVNEADSPEYIAVDFICFTGGADVHPSLYNEEPDGKGYYNQKRDSQEIQVYNQYKNKIPMVGICRGGQFLNVMNGGKMLQDLKKSHDGIREVVDRVFLLDQSRLEETYLTLESHHQGMVPNDTGAYPILWDSEDNNYEAIYYKDTNCLCFQPHPEWGHKETEKLFFSLLEEYLK